MGSSTLPRTYDDPLKHMLDTEKKIPVNLSNLSNKIKSEIIWKKKNGSHFVKVSKS